MARQPDGDPASLLKDIRSLRARVDRLEGASPLTGSGMSVPAAGVLQVTGRLDVVGGLSYSAAWGPAMAYRAGQLVVEPGGTLVTAKADHTSGDTYSPANWSSAAVAGSRRGGRYSSPANALTPATATTVTLSRVSGDTDLVSGGSLVIPTDAGGVWAVNAVWGSGAVQNANQMFLDVKVDFTESYRGGIAYQDNQAVATAVVALVAGNVLRFNVFASAGTAYTTGVIVNAYRIGV